MMASLGHGFSDELPRQQERSYWDSEGVALSACENDGLIVRLRDDRLSYLPGLDVRGLPRLADSRMTGWHVQEIHRFVTTRTCLGVWWEHEPDREYR